jgi:6-phosphofructokinase 1
VRFGVRSVQHLEQFAGKTKMQIVDDKDSSTVIGIRAAKVSVTSMEFLEKHETDWQRRRPKNPHWLHMKNIGDILAGRPREAELPSDSVVFTVA